GVRSLLTCRWVVFFFSSRRRHTRWPRDWSSDVCSSDLMIADSAVRASIVPAIPRVSVYVHKFNYSHDLIFETGHYVLHLLRDDQFELIHRLGFTSGRARDKLAGVPHRTGTPGVPGLDNCSAN